MASASARKMKTKNAFENLALGRKSGVEKGGCWPKMKKWFKRTREVIYNQRDDP
jgi:hypothetical protein